MKKTAFLQALILASLLAVSWLLLLNRFKPTPDQPLPQTIPAEKALSGAAAQDADQATSPELQVPASSLPPEPPEGWREWTAYLDGMASARDRRWALGELRDALFSQPTDEAVARISELLESGYDRPTGLLFQVGPEGRLAGAGSLRAQLLDWLGQLDPLAAATYARQQLASVGTRLPEEEYVLHLRNFAWGTAESADGGEAFLSRHFQNLLENPAWMENPGPATAEAMDVAVYLADPDWVPAMAGLDLPSQPDALRHAGSIALERLVDLNPLPAIERLLDSPEGQQLDLRTRASLVARLDPVDPASQNLLDEYLTASSTSPAEATAFLAYFPNLNLSLSNNLLSGRMSVSAMTPHMERLQRALQQVEGWLRNPAMEALAPKLEETRQRLQQQMGGEPAP